MLAKRSLWWRKGLVAAGKPFFYWWISLWGRRIKRFTHAAVLYLPQILLSADFFRLLLHGLYRRMRTSPVMWDFWSFQQIMVSWHGLLLIVYGVESPRRVCAYCSEMRGMLEKVRRGCSTITLMLVCLQHNNHLFLFLYINIYPVPFRLPQATMIHQSMA